MNRAFGFIEKSGKGNGKADQKGVLADYTRAIEHEPESPVAYFNRALAKAGLGDHKGAVKDFDKSLEINSESAGTYYRRGISKISLEIEMYREAVSHFDNPVRLGQEFAEAYLSRGLARHYLDDIKGSINDFDSFVKNKPDSYPGYLGRGFSIILIPLGFKSYLGKI